MAELRVVGREGARTADDAALVARIRARDVRAFEAFYKANHVRLSRFLANLLRRPHLVDEVLGDTMMAVWNGIDGFRGGSLLTTWMFGIAYRQAMSALRKLDEPIDAARPDEQGAGDTLEPEEVAGRESAARALGAAVGRLSAAHRAVVTLTYQQELGYREIAEILDCPVDTVKTRMFHARRQLRARLTGDLADWL